MAISIHVNFVVIWLAYLGIQCSSGTYQGDGKSSHFVPLVKVKFYDF